MSPLSAITIPPPLLLLALLGLLTPCHGASLVPSHIYEPPVPVPKVRFENDRYPENFITQEQTTLRLFWEGDQSSAGPPIRAYQLEMAKLPRQPSIVDTTVADVADSIIFETYTTDMGLLSAPFRR